MAAMSPAELLKAWQDVYLAQSQMARVGTLFKGTVHNLNGVLQATSMQSELFAMTFAKVDTLLGQALSAADNEECRQKIVQVIELLHKRKQTLDQVNDKVFLGQEILKGVNGISQSSALCGSETLRSLTDNVLTFFSSNMFFKHQVRKNITIEGEMFLGVKGFEVSVVLANLLENSIVAMETNPGHEPLFSLRCYVRADNAVIDVEDNGTGVASEVRATLFDEFVSTWVGHAGLGLYYARQLVSAMGGVVQLVNPVDPTVFRVTLPVNLEEV